MHALDRRQLLQGLAAAPRKADLIRQENKRPGTTDWQLTYTR
jgi:hypothetical protein